MPIITIKTLPQPKPVNTTAILKRICKESAQALDYDPKHVWATWEYIQPGNYVTGELSSDIQQEHTHSPIVHVLSFEGKEQELIEKMLVTIADVISSGLNISKGNVFIYYTEARSGRVFDGGRIIYKK